MYFAARDRDINPKVVADDATFGMNGPDFAEMSFYCVSNFDIHGAIVVEFLDASMIHAGKNV